MSLIDDIYKGDLYPAEQVVPGSAAFKEHCRKAEDLAEKLKSTHTEDQRGILEEYRGESDTLTDIYNSEFYRAGVRFGIRFIIEVLYGHAELPDIHK